MMIRPALLPLLPLCGAFLCGVWAMIAACNKQVARRIPIALLSNFAAFGSFFVALGLWHKILALPEDQRVIRDVVFPWLQAGSLEVPVAFVLDPLSTLMILIVTGVGSLIHLYSIGYMSHEKAHARYFAYLNLFLAAMLVLVLGDSLPLLFVGWEGVGVCSYLLIGFWFDDPEKAKAGKKAFLVNRVGDLGFLLGIFTAFMAFQTLEISALQESIRAGSISPLWTWMAIFLFIGACGKSAQFPLHIWLPDAMAGPTPVSALIHAATMVTAGVYMIARLSFLFSAVPAVGEGIAFVGVATALTAALIALVQTDIKKVLAYSTVSQLGFMVVAVGLGHYTAGIFHLTTHAFFKALLFLGAGSVIHALHEEQDLRNMGGLARKIPITYWTFVIGWAAIIGLPPFSGFFSKDEILFGAALGGHAGIFIGLWIAAVLTAFYMTRLMILAFWTPFRGDVKSWEKVHESPWVMAAPLCVLAALSAFGGVLNLPHYLRSHDQPAVLEHFLKSVFVVADHGSEHALFGEGVGILLALTAAALGAGLSWWLYHGGEKVRKSLVATPWLTRPLEEKLYVDSFVSRVLVRPILWFAENILWIGVDVSIIDATLNRLARGVCDLGERARQLQSGKIRIYVLSVAVGMAFVVGALVWGQG